MRAPVGVCGTVLRPNQQRDGAGWFGLLEMDKGAACVSDPPGTETRSRRHMKRKTSRKKRVWLIGAGSVECPNRVGDTSGVFVQLPSSLGDQNGNVPVACSPRVKWKLVESLGYQFCGSDFPGPESCWYKWYKVEEARSHGIRRELRYFMEPQKAILGWWGS